MTHKSHDLAVKIGTYEKNGETKGRYKNCGMVLQKEDGGEIIMIDPTFNFAGVKRGEDRDMVIISKFEVKEKQPAAQEWSE